MESINICKLHLPTHAAAVRAACVLLTYTSFFVFFLQGWEEIQNHSSEFLEIIQDKGAFQPHGELIWPRRLTQLVQLPQAQLMGHACVLHFLVSLSAPEPQSDAKNKNPPMDRGYAGVI